MLSAEMKQYNVAIFGREDVRSSNWVLTRLAALLGAGSAFVPALALAEMDVVASIKPVHSLVAGVMQGIGEPVLLVKGAGSEHGYNVRPSEARSLDQAEVVFWVGESLETFLIKLLQALAGDAKVVELWRVPGLTHLPTREGGMWEAHEHGDTNAGADADEGKHPEEHEHEGEHAEPHRHSGAENEAAEEHAPGQTDMHIWLDPGNAQVLTAAIAAALGDADPPNASIYRANAERLRRQLDELDRSLEDRLTAIADRPYVVFHDAYQYFERRYGVQAVGAITINPTVRPSARRLQEVQERLRQLDAACVFAEPQFEPALVDTVIEGTGARKGVLDPLGADLEAGPEQYFQLMYGLADSLIACLGEAR
jgi:zinc transport system substrate-binding protein